MLQFFRVFIYPAVGNLWFPEWRDPLLPSFSSRNSQDIRERLCLSPSLCFSLSLSQRLAGHGRGGVLTLPTKATKNSRVTTGIAFIS